MEAVFVVPTYLYSYSRQAAAQERLLSATPYAAEDNEQFLILGTPQLLQVHI